MSGSVHDLNYAVGRYLRERPRFPDAASCLAFIVTVCNRIPEAAVRRSFDGLKWEQRYQDSLKQRFPEVENPSPMDMVRQDATPEDVLAKLVEAEKVAFDNMNWHAEVLGANPGDADASTSWASSFKTWTGAVGARQAQADVVRRQELEIANTPKWQARHKAIVDDLMKEYDGKGVQYELVIDATADAAVQLERLRQSERQAHPKEIEVWHKNLLACVRRLQMYTESAKVETTTKMINEVMNDVLIELERIVKPGNPALWQMCTLAVEHYISERRTLAS